MQTTSSTSRHIATWCCSASLLLVAPACVGSSGSAGGGQLAPSTDAGATSDSAGGASSGGASSGGASSGGASSGGASSGGASTGSAAVAEHDKMTKAASGAFCDLFVKCKAMVSGVMAFSTLEGCQAFMATNEADSSEEREAIKAGTAAFDTAQAAACIAKLKAFSCPANGMLDMNSLFATAAATCESVITGSMDDGKACSHNVTCKSGFCKKNSEKPGCPGTCVAAAGKDQPCDESNGPPCASGLYCRAGKCSDKLLGDAGDGCGGDAPCASDLLCSKGQCYPMGKVGDSCVDSTTTKGCAAGAKCSFATGKCAALAKAGQACGSAAGGLECATGLLCKDDKCADYQAIGAACSSDNECFGIDTACVESKCAALPISGEGGPCKPVDFEKGSFIEFGCKPGLTCAKTSSTCAPRPSTGEACVENCQAGLHCVGASGSKTCAAPVAKGSECGASTAPCAAGLMCGKAGKCEAPVCG